MRWVSRLAIVLSYLVSPVAGAQSPSDRTALAGHVPPLPATARAGDAEGKSSPGLAEPMTLTIVLERDDVAGFGRFLERLYDPGSPEFGRFSTPQALAERFGPSPSAYAGVRDWFAAQGLTVVAESSGRQWLSVRGSRAAVESALKLDVVDYRDGERRFFANTGAPQLPPALAPHVQAVLGLSDMARPQRSSARNDGTAIRAGAKRQAIIDAFRAICKGLGGLGYGNDAAAAAAWNKGCDSFLPAGGSNGSSGSSGGRAVAGSGAWLDLDGNGQHIGLLQFDTLVRSDIEDYFALLELPPEVNDRLHEVHVNGGAPPGADQAEVLLDIGFIMPLVPAADVTVYDAPFIGSGSFQMLFGRMIDDGVSIISNSWSYCENQTTPADVQSIDAILQTAAAAGISVFNASGDSGSTCLNGSPNTVGVPSGSPHATAVGGSSSPPGIGGTHGAETWWNASGDTPPGGQGGFGVSRFFARPAYQNGHTASAMRSVPDVVTNADPRYGIQICQGANGGCPAPLLYGGTSMAAPAWAAYTARLNQARGSNLGFLNPQLYPLAGSDAFHSPASLGSDFAHVGLGSPNVNRLHVRLNGIALGAVDATLSEMSMSVRIEDADVVFGNADGIPADGTTPLRVKVIVRDGGGHTLDGRQVVLSANPGSAAVITPANALSSVANGAALFQVTDLTSETVTFSATVDGVPLTATAQADFVAPPAAAASIMAIPTTVAANGLAFTTITVTLVDGLGRPSPGKLVTISQGGGHASVDGPSPGVTGPDGTIQFTARNLVNETIDFTAVDVTDGELPVPGVATVVYSNAPFAYCVPPTPTAADGYAIEPFVTGVEVGPLFYGNINFGNCAGTNDPGFDPAGNVIVTSLRTGEFFRLPPDGGAATAPLALLGPTVGRVVYGGDGRFYSGRAATTGNWTTGDVIEVDPATGALLRVVAPNITCPTPPVVDPISGDLFVGSQCFGAGSDVPHIYRITDPGDTDPNVPTAAVIYATLPTTPTGQLAFAPDGTLYAITGYMQFGGGTVTRIAGTDQPQPPAMTSIPEVRSTYTLAMGTTHPDGSALSLLTHVDNNLVESFIEDDPITSVTLAQGIGAGVTGPDGCLYSAHFDTIYRLAPADGPCEFSSSSGAPLLTLSPTRLAADPETGETIVFTATLRNVGAPEDAPVFFTVSGANEQTRLVRAAAGGTATLELTGVFTGDDTIVASSTIEAMELTSNRAKVRWTDGVHTSFIALQPPFGAVQGIAVTLAANLVDVSLDPSAPLAGVTVSFEVGSESCVAVTAASGRAQCSVVMPAEGNFVLRARYAGDAQHAAAEASSQFTVMDDRIFADGFED